MLKAFTAYIILPPEFWHVSGYNAAQTICPKETIQKANCAALSGKSDYEFYNS